MLRVQVSVGDEPIAELWVRRTEPLENMVPGHGVASYEARLMEPMNYAGPVWFITDFDRSRGWLALLGELARAYETRRDIADQEGAK